MTTAEYVSVGPANPIKGKPQRDDLNLPRGYLSWSQVRSYLTCAACFEARYIHAEPTLLTPPLVYGSAVHKGLEHARRVVLAGEKWHIEDCLDAGRDGFDAALTGLDRNGEAPAVAPELKLPRSYSSWGTVKDDAIAALKHALPKILAAELACGIRAVEAAVEMRGVFAFPFVAYADVVLEDPTLENDAVITDAKTSSSDSLPDEWAAWQLAVYALPWHHAGESLGLGVNQIVKTKTPNVHLWTEKGYSLSPTPAQFAWLERLITSVAEDISAGRFPASPSPFGCEHPHPGPKFTMSLS